MNLIKKIKQANFFNFWFILLISITILIVFVLIFICNYEINKTINAALICDQEGNCFIKLNYDFNNDDIDNLKIILKGKEFILKNIDIQEINKNEYFLFFDLNNNDLIKLIELNCSYPIQIILKKIKIILLMFN